MTLPHVFLEYGFSVELLSTQLTVISSVLQCMRPYVPNSLANFLANLALLDNHQVWLPTHFFCLLLSLSWNQAKVTPDSVLLSL